MKPLKLELMGFGCFRELTEVSFEDLNLFAIAGPTGSGKSTLLDAITYALYGQTPRLGSRGLDVLISPGIDQLQVTLTFEVPGGAVYQVGRTLHRSKRTESQVRLEVQDTDYAGKWKRVPDTEKVRALNDKVTQLVGLDYDGFTRAVLLPQGAFDEFLRGNASARRDLLINLLGIDTLEKMQKRASEIARETKNTINNLYTRLEEDFSGATPERLEELAAAKRHYEVDRKQQQADLERLSRELQDLHDLKSLTEKLQQAEQEQAQFDAQVDEHEKRKKQLEHAEQAALLRPQWELLKQHQDSVTVSQNTLDELTRKQQRAQQAFNDAKTGLEQAQKDAEVTSDIDKQLRDLETAQGLLEQLTARGGSLKDAEHGQEGITYSEKAWQAQQDISGVVRPLERAESELARAQKQHQQQQTAFEKAHKTFTEAEKALEQAQQDAEATSDIDKQLRDLETAQGLLKQLTARGGSLDDAKHAQDDVTYDETAWQKQQTLDAKIPQLARAERDVQEAEKALDAVAKSLAEAEKTLEQQQSELDALEQQGKDAKAQLDDLTERLNAAKIADEAAAVRVHLHEGEPCPVCEQIVQTLPKVQDVVDIAALTEQQKVAQEDVEVKRQTYTNKRSDVRLTEQRLKDLQTEQTRQQEVLKTAQTALTEQQKLFTDMLEPVTADAAKAALEQQRRALLGDLAQSILEKTNGEDPQKLAKDLQTRKKALEQTLKTTQDAFNQAQRELDRVSTQLEQSQRDATSQQTALAEARAQLQQKLSQHAAVIPLELADDVPAQEVKTAVEQNRRALLGHLAQNILEKTAGEDPDALAKTLTERKKALEQSLNTAQDGLNTAQRELDKVNTQLEQQRDYHSRYETALKDAQQSLEEALREANFADIAALEDALLSDQGLRELREHVKQVTEDVTRVARRIADLQKQLAGRSFEPEHYQTVKTAKDAVSDALAESQKNLGAVAQQEEHVREQLERASSLRDQLPKLEKRLSIYDRLNQDLRSNNFQDFVITRVQKQLAIRASDIIREVSDGRYDLRLIDGEYHVIDAWNAGESRSAKTLSGGETFIASLALALALSDTVASGVSLGALFLDEGFGTLDSESLEAVTQVLEHLSSEGRIVGIITHVKDLTERLPERLMVQKGPEGSTLHWA
jgi:exonuclease SbcC